IGEISHSSRQVGQDAKNRETGEFMDGPAVTSRMPKAESGPAPKVQVDLRPLPRPKDPARTAGVSLWSDLGLLVVLIVFSGSLRVWLMCHTEVAARDSIGFVRYALELESQPWSEVLPKNLQHPGYPLALMLVSWPVRFVLGSTDCFTMQLSAQLTSSLAGVLLVIPMFYLGRELFNR